MSTRGWTRRASSILFDVRHATQVNGVAGGRTVFTLVQTAGADTVLGTPDDAFTFTLLDQVDHTPLATGGGDAETIVLSLASVFVATDFDGDSVVIDAGATVTIENDVPINYTPASATIADIAGTVISRDLDTSLGADEPGTMAITSFTTGGTTVTTNGANSTLTYGGQNILLSGFGTTTLTGFVDVGGGVGVYDPGTDTLVFTMTLLPGTDTYQFNLVNTIDNGSGAVFENLTGIGGGNNFWKVINSTSANSTQILLTSTDNTAHISSDTDDVGVAPASSSIKMKACALISVILITITLVAALMMIALRWWTTPGLRGFRSTSLESRTAPPPMYISLLGTRMRKKT